MSTESISGFASAGSSFEASSNPFSCLETSNIVGPRISLASRAEAMNKKIQQLDVDELERINNALTDLDKHDLENTQEFINACETQKAWSSKYLLSSIVTALSSIATASALYANHLVQGIQMGVAGTLQLFNIVMDNRNAWQSVAEFVSGGNKEREENIRAGLPFVTNLMILALTTYSFLTLPVDHDSLMATLNQFVGYLNMAFGSVEIFTIYKKNVAEQKLVEGQNKRFEYSQENQMISEDFEFHVESARRIVQENKKATEQYIQITSRIAAKTA